MRRSARGRQKKKESDFEEMPVSCRFTKALARRIRNEASKEERTFSNMVRLLCGEALDRRGRKKRTP